MERQEKQERLRWKIGVAASLIVTSATAWAVCPPQFQEMWVQPEFVSATAAMKAAIAAMDSTLSAQLETNNQRVMSAISVLTKQKALAASQIADGNRVSAQTVATGLNVLAQTERVKQARFDYSGEFGQGFNPCVVTANRSIMANRDAAMPGEVRTRVASEVLAAPGHYSDPLLAQAALLDAHKSFCTKDQVDSGLCKQVGSIPGADLTVRTLFTPSMEGEELYKAKLTFVNNVVGLPDGPVPASSANSPAAQAYAAAKARKDALISPAIASLKEIQLDSSGIDTAHGGKDIPMSLQFQREVKRYSGNSPEYDQWSKVMVAQNERGAMIELLKIKALDLAIREKQYRQYEKMEAQLAALVAIEAGSGTASNTTSAAAAKATKENAINAIK